MQITRMQVNHITNPLGFDLGERPTFTWVVDGARGRGPRPRAWW